MSNPFTEDVTWSGFVQEWLQIISWLFWMGITIAGICLPLYLFIRFVKWAWVG